MFNELANCSNTNTTLYWYNVGNKNLFWVLVSIRVLISIAGIAGNTMVIYAATRNRKAIFSSFRYLNRVVLSLAFADLFYSLLGQPFDILHWYLSLTGIGPQLREHKCGSMWIMSIMTFPQDVCSGASCFHVALILLLRCFCLMKPMSFEKWHLRLTKISIVGIWIYMISVVLMPTFISIMLTADISKDEYKNYKNAYSIGWNIVYQATLTLSLGLNIILGMVNIYLLKKQEKDKERGSTFSTNPDIVVSGASANSVLHTQGTNSRASRKKALEKMIKMVTIGTIICYTPNIIFRSYLMHMVQQSTSGNAYDGTGKVLFAFFARIGVQMGSIINPFIYATTIPQFKKLAKRYLRSSFRMKTVETRSGPTAILKAPDVSSFNSKSAY